MDLEDNFVLFSIYIGNVIFFYIMYILIVHPEVHFPSKLWIL